MNNTKTVNDKNDLEGVKKDIESLAKNLGTLKEESVEILMSQIDDLVNVIGKFKEKGVDIGRENLEGLYTSTRKHPLRSLLYAFGVGILTCYFIKKK